MILKGTQHPICQPSCFPQASVYALPDFGLLCLMLCLGLSAFSDSSDWSRNSGSPSDRNEFGKILTWESMAPFFETLTADPCRAHVLLFPRLAESAGRQNTVETEGRREHVCVGLDLPQYLALLCCDLLD